MDNPEPNLLAGESSPYLLQHARNPVRWYPWGEKAFLKAREEDKPVFLSVGYSTCHWCHVMARESFEDKETARVLNMYFVPVKVDREERPDVNRMFMSYVQATTGGGGWPMNVWLTPDLKPFYGGTYYPPEDRWGMPAFRAVLKHIATAWTERRKDLVASADAVIRQMQAQEDVVTPGIATEPDWSLLDGGYRQIESTYDGEHGGFGTAPKFPRPVLLNFLIRYHSRLLRDTIGGNGRTHALEMVHCTLRKMSDGGMRDQLGGGFHRYSVDALWHVPHFEKMLYDQAQLVCSCIEMHQVTRDPFYADVTRSTLDFVLREMTGPEGQFYSALDADSPLPGNPAAHGEGAFYTWSKADIESLLGDDAGLFCCRYGVEERGNAPADPQGEFAGLNILAVSRTTEETAAVFGIAPDEAKARIEAAREKLLLARAQRPRPHLDDKTLTCWYGLMISAFARASGVLDNTTYADAATKAARFVETRLFDSNSGRLLRRCRAGNAAIDGFVDDYAFLIQGLLDLYENTFDSHWLTMALTLQERQDSLFLDANRAVYFSTTGTEPGIPLRLKEDYDGAEPSPNSVSATNLLRLWQMTGNPEYREKAVKLVRSFVSLLEVAPHAMPQMLVACDLLLSEPVAIVITGKTGAADTRALLREVNTRFLPHRTLILADSTEKQATLAKAFPYLKDIKPVGGRATAYVCRHHACHQPVTDPSALGKLLDGHV